MLSGVNADGIKSFATPKRVFVRAHQNCIFELCRTIKNASAL
jgi:hypothetical protein